MLRDNFIALAAQQSFSLSPIRNDAAPVFCAVR